MNYRTRKSLATNSIPEDPDNEDTPQYSDSYQTPQSSCNTTLNGIPESKQKKNARKQANKRKAKAYRIIEKQNITIKNLQRQLERYKKRYYRQKNQPSLSPSPRKQTNNLLKGLKVTKEVKRQLTYGLALKKQLASQAKSIKPGTKKQQFFMKAIGNKILKKYRMQTYMRGIISRKVNERLKLTKQNGILTSYVRKKKIFKVTESVKKSIKDFLEDDSVSRMCPGKKEFVRRGKERKQRRILLDTLKNLHRKFTSTTKINISYPTFCREKPFWIQKPKVQDHDTCACARHTNMELMFSKLKQIHFVKEKSLHDMVNAVCCISKSKECMQNICNICKGKTVEFALPKDFEVKYYQWENIIEEKEIKGEKKKELEK
ncbi:uncharacterized protein LOC129225507 [Uloborus diversus]|uniref:uncharacterized protein LOC129225507 n=1 Tax=Uloborus diversus TaxID=327109 RepID=UPI00240A4573|nr:uncharacterized protein LOC129225507 [Uloborus diversus]